MTMKGFFNTWWHCLWSGEGHQMCLMNPNEKGQRYWVCSHVEDL